MARLGRGRRVETQALLAAAHPDNTQTWPGMCRSLFFFFFFYLRWDRASGEGVCVYVSVITNFHLVPNDRNCSPCSQAYTGGPAP